MSDDRWLRELAQVNQEREAEERSQLDERWDRLSAGELSPEEEAELRALAETSEEAHEAYEAFRPLGPELQARVVQAIQSQGREETEAAEAARKKPESGKLFSFPRRARFAAWGTAAAAAAAILMISLREPAPLPDYASVDVFGGTSVTRGEQPETATPIFTPGDDFEMDLSPRTTGSYEKRLDAKGVLACGGELWPVEVQSKFALAGSVQMNGSIPDAHPGLCVLWAIVCRGGKMPDPADLIALSTGGVIRQRNCVAVPKNVRIQPRGP